MKRVLGNLAMLHNVDLRRLTRRSAPHTLGILLFYCANVMQDFRIHGAHSGSASIIIPYTSYIFLRNLHFQNILYIPI